MITVPALEYAAALVLTLGVLAWANRLKTRYVKVLWFADYFSYLLFFYLLAIATQIVPHLGFQEVPGAGYAGEAYYFLLLTFLGLPLVLLSFFYFLRFAGGLAGRNTAPFVRPGYLIGFAAVFLACTFAALWAFQTRNIGFLARSQTAMTVLAVGLLVMIPVRAAFLARATKNPLRTREIIRFAAAQLAGFAGGQLILILILDEDAQFGHHLVRLLVNIPPLAVLARIAGKEMAANGEAPESRMDIETAFAKMDITPREGDVIRLVLQGKTNAEIAAELFISLKTVKHHLYNAFMKLRIKNRVQLVNLFLAFNRPSPRHGPKVERAETPKTNAG
jgi:DNA-binding CsgD family transcriptional regulator